MATEIVLDLCTPEGKTWLARITGPDPRYGVARDFIRPVSKVTSRSGRTGRYEYLIEPGVYERHEGRRSLGHQNGFFQVTSEGEITPLDSASAALDALTEPASNHPRGTDH
jgi:hypothetical protein